ncbi:carboxylate--amine ligase [Antribacter sp. KLBMP9083]|uniref:Carboxylate--amine ligase n=1 Tax=Antribacter soli TaxID=2910976 RepID=A0AA41U9S0_9MICO|nr:carboxylate--amine ligase [Antribacter soli]MCF4121907.1 carboxylate--amine ligase [Antribacter soli]
MRGFPRDMTPGGSPSVLDGDNLMVVGIGGDIGMYALCRAFHEQYGATAVVISTVATRPMQDSAIVTNLVVPDMDDTETFLTSLEKVAVENPGKHKVLLTNADWFVRTVIQNRDRLEAAGYVTPYPSLEVLEQVSTKEGFANVCDQLGIPTPRTVVVNVPMVVSTGGRASVPAMQFDLDFPVVAKPSSSADWHHVSFPGKAKIHHVETRAELDELIGHLVDAGYPSALLVQEFIPGDETQMRSLTAYRDTTGTVTLLATGRVLLEEHTPGTLGIPAAILVEPYDDAMEAATRFLDATGYVGFANFDYKLDPRTGRHVYFEVNPRIGRNNYYVTAGGANVARVLIEDQVLGRPILPVRAVQEILYTVVPFGLLLKYVLDPALRDRLKGLKASGRVVNPLKYDGDSGLKRRLIVEGVTQNYRRKYAQYYPEPTSTGT